MPERPDDSPIGSAGGNSGASLARANERLRRIKSPWLRVGSKYDPKPYRIMFWLGEWRHAFFTRSKVAFKSHKLQRFNLKLVAFTVISVAVVGTAAWSWHDRQLTHLTDTMLDEAAVHEESRRWSEAAELLYRAGRLLPEDARLASRLEHAREQSAEPRRKELESALESAEISMRAGNYPQARSEYETAIRLRPDDPRGYLGAGVACSRQGKVEEAIKIWTTGDLQTRSVGDNLNLMLPMADAMIDLGRAESTGPLIQRLHAGVARVRTGGAIPVVELAHFEAAVAFVEARALSVRGLESESTAILRNALKRADLILGPHAVSPPAARLARALAERSLRAGEWEIAAQQFARSAQFDPELVANRLTAGQAWRQAGNLKEARLEFQKACAAPAVSAEAWLELARLELGEQSLRPASERNWERFDAAIGHTRNEPKIADENVLLEADSLAARQDAQAAVERLRDALALRPHSDRLATALGVFLLRSGRTEELQKLIDEWSRWDESAAAARFLRSRLLLHDGRVQAAIATLRAAAENAPPRERRALSAEIARIYFEHDQARQAEAELRSLLGDGQLDVTLLTQGTEAALAAHDSAAVARWLEDWGRFGGKGASHYRYYQARALLSPASKSGADAQRQARELVRSLCDERPNWPAAWVLDGQLLEQSQSWSEAIDAYRRAISLGDATPRVRQRLVALLCSQSRVSEALKYLQATAGDVNQNAAAVALQVRYGSTAEAVESARRHQAADLGDPERRLLLADALRADGQLKAASETLEEAVRLAPDQAGAWLMLFEIQLRMPASTAARRTLVELEANAKLPTATRDLLLARGYWRLGENDEADRRYRQLLSVSAPEPGACLEAAAFFESREPALAQRALQIVSDRAPQTVAARRALARLWAAQSNPASHARALELITPLAADFATAEPADVRLRAELLGKKNRPGAPAEAIAWLERWLAQAPPGHGTEERLMLGKFYEQQRNFAAAEQAYRQSLAAEIVPAQAGRAYIDFLLRRERLDDAEQALKKAEHESSGGLAWAALWARWFAQAGRVQELDLQVEERLKKEPAFSGTPTERAALMQSAGDILAFHGRDESAERWYRQCVAIVPRRWGALASFLAAHDRHLEAIDVFESVWKNQPSTTELTALLNFLQTAPPDPSLFARLKPLVAEAHDRFPDDSRLQASWALIQLSQGRTEGAIADQRRLVADAPQSSVLRNNLALMLALVPGSRDEAAQVAEKLAQQEPGNLEFRDTLAVVCLLRGESAKAKELLQVLVDSGPASASHWLHYAVACRKIGESAEAKRAFEQAKTLGARRLACFPAEREWFVELAEALR